MDYFHKYNKYKSKYLNLKNNIGGAALVPTERDIELTDEQKLSSISEWDEHYLIFLNILLICVGIRKCYLYPSNLSTEYNKKYLDEVLSILEIRKLQYLKNNIELSGVNIFLYDDENDKYVKKEGILLKKKDIDIDYDKMGLGEKASTINEVYIGEMLGFDQCSGQDKASNVHELIFPGNGMTFMQFKCEDSNNIMLNLEDFWEFLKENEYLNNIITKYICNNNNLFFYYTINKTKKNKKVWTSSEEGIQEIEM